MVIFVSIFYNKLGVCCGHSYPLPFSSKNIDANLCKTATRCTIITTVRNRKNKQNHAKHTTARYIRFNMKIKQHIHGIIYSTGQVATQQYIYLAMCLYLASLSAYHTLTLSFLKGHSLAVLRGAMYLYGASATLSTIIIGLILSFSISYLVALTLNIEPNYATILINDVILMGIIPTGISILFALKYSSRLYHSTRQMSSRGEFRTMLALDISPYRLIFTPQILAGILTVVAQSITMAFISVIVMNIMVPSIAGVTREYFNFILISSINPGDIVQFLAICTTMGLALTVFPIQAAYAVSDSFNRTESFYIAMMSIFYSLIIINVAGAII